MTEPNDSRARRSNGPRRRANYAKINWTKRDKTVVSSADLLHGAYRMTERQNRGNDEMHDSRIR